MLKKRIISITAILALLIGLLQFQSSDMRTEAATYYTLSRTGTYTLTTKIIVTSYSNARFNMMYNIGKLSKSPYQKEISLKVYGSGAKLKKYSDGRRRLVVNSTNKSGRAVYKVVRVFKNSAISYNKNLLAKASSSYKGYKAYKKYTSAETKIESNNSKIIKKAKSLFKGIKSPYKKAEKAFTFVNKYMTYGGYYRNKGALSALEHKSGVCEDYADLFIALLRASGVPARIAAGYWVVPNKFVNKKVNYVEGYSHAWPEFYLPKYGWIVAEPTFTYIDYRGNKIVDYNFFAKISSPSHFLTGYDTTGDNAVSLIGFSSNVNCQFSSTIVKK